jgi:Ca-activated chloride channel family protein
MDVRLSRRPIERYEWPLSAALIALALSILIPERKRVRERRHIPAPTRNVAHGVAGGPVRTAATTAALLILLASFSYGAAAPGIDAYRDGKFEDAYSQFQQTLKSHPESRADDKLQFDSGAAAYKLKDYNRALESFSQALLTRDTGLQSKGHYNLGNTLYQRGEAEKTDEKKLSDWTNALDHYEQTLKLNPNDKDAKDNYDYVKRKIEELKNKKSQQQPSPSPSPSPPQKNKQNQKNKQDQQQQQNQDQQNQQQKQQKDQQQQQQKDQQQQQQQNQQQQQGQGQDEKKDQQQQSQDQQSQDKSRSDKEQKQENQKDQAQAKNEPQKKQQQQPGESPSPSPGEKQQPNQPSPSPGERQAEESPTPGEGENETPSPSPGEGEDQNGSEGDDENASPSATPAESPEKKFAGEVKGGAGEDKSQKPPDKNAQVAEAESEKEGQMSERQALALLESMKDEEARVQLDERKVRRRVYNDW